MVRVAQLGIVLGILGVMVTLIGLFPTLLGLPPTPGIGIMQILAILVGFVVLTLGALIYVRFMFYATQPLTLMQQIGVRISLTGLTFAALAALADILGFGSNLSALGEDILLGPIQMIGLLLCFGLSAVGVLIFAVAGTPVILDEND